MSGERDGRRGFDLADNLVRDVVVNGIPVAGLTADNISVGDISGDDISGADISGGGLFVDEFCRTVGLGEFDDHPAGGDGTCCVRVRYFNNDRLL